MNLDLQIPCDIAPVTIDPAIRGGGGGLGRPLDKWGARSPKNFFRPFGPQFGLKVSGADPPAPRPLPWIRHCLVPCCVSYVGRLITSTGC